MNQSAELSVAARRKVLAAAFVAWMFAGLENGLFVLIHRQMMRELLGASAAEGLILQWLAWNQAAFMLGAAAGGWLFGWLGDRAGRTRALGCSVLCYSLLTLAAWFVDDPYLMWVVRFLAMLGFGGTWPNAVSLVAEAWPGASRPFLAGLLGTAANVGMVLMGTIGWVQPVTDAHWRWTLLVASTPAVVGLWILRRVPESQRWLSEHLAASSRPRELNVATGPRSGPLRELFRPPLLQHTLLGIALGAVPVIGTAANGNWVVPWSDRVAADRARTEQLAADPSAAKPGASAAEAAQKKSSPRTAAQVSRDKAFTLISRSGGGVLGSLMGGIAATLAGRRLSYFLISLASLVTSTVLFTQLSPGHPWFNTAAFLLGMFGVTYFGWLPLFLPELFPTRVRAAGSGIAFNSGRIAAAAVTVFIALWMQNTTVDYPLIGFCTGLIYAVGMLIIWLAPTGPIQGDQVRGQER
ncbi:MAG: MFS transporter [Planctomycetota bacterium]